MSSSQPPTADAATATTMKPPNEPLSSSLPNHLFLSPFLPEDFSPTAYLNPSLPAYSPHYHSKPAPHSSSHHNSLGTLHTAASSLLSELDANLNRLQATLSGLT